MLRKREKKKQTENYCGLTCSPGRWSLTTATCSVCRRLREKKLQRPHAPFAATPFRRPALSSCSLPTARSLLTALHDNCGSSGVTRKPHFHRSLRTSSLLVLLPRWLIISHTMLINCEKYFVNSRSITNILQVKISFKLWQLVKRCSM